MIATRYRPTHICTGCCTSRYSIVRKLFFNRSGRITRLPPRRLILLLIGVRDKTYAIPPTSSALVPGGRAGASRPGLNRLNPFCPICKTTASAPGGPAPIRPGFRTSSVRRRSPGESSARKNVPRFRTVNTRNNGDSSPGIRRANA